MTRTLFSRITALVAAVASVVLSLAAPQATAQTAVTVVEYYNKTVAAYFLTGRANEQATLDGISDFQRTGMTFQAVTAASATSAQSAVCRYRILVNASSGVNSHFYGLKSGSVSTAATNLPDFFT